MSCDVGQYLLPDDKPIQEVERLVHLPKGAFPRNSRRRQGRGSSFVPKSRMEMSVVSEEGHNLTLVAYMEKWSKSYVELYRGDLKIRSLHSHSGHSNPEYGIEIGNGHMHFPSQNYPLVEKKSQYAYAVDFPFMDRLTDSVQFFGTVVNIEIDALQLQLESGGRR